MVESRWFRRAGPGIVAVGAVVLVATATLAARDRPSAPPTCAGQAGRGGTSGAWYRIAPRVEAGERRGQTLWVGRPGGSAPRVLDLDPESFASGPFDGRVLVGTDDGTASRLSLLDAADGCAWPIAVSADVIRRATLTPSGDSVVEFRVDRRTRRDLGVWERSLRPGAGATQLLPPIAADGRFGVTWSTELQWSVDGRVLAVQSCGEVACRSRLLDTASGHVHELADPALGAIVGVDRDRVVAFEACRGFPCPLDLIDLTAGSRTNVDPLAGEAVVATDERGRRWAVYDQLDGGLRSVALDDRTVRDLMPEADARRRLLGTPTRSGVGADLPPGWVLVASGDTHEPIGSSAPDARRVSDGRIVHFDEVPR